MDLEQIGVLNDFFLKGGSLRMLKDMPQENLDILYLYGQQQLQQQNVVAARNIFYMLTYCDQWNSDFVLALGVAYQQEQDHDNALLCFAQAAQVIVTDPRPPYLAALSYLAQLKWDWAEKALDTAMMLCHTQPKWRELKLEIERQRTIFVTERGKNGN